MTIQEDAAMILALIYYKYINKLESQLLSFEVITNNSDLERELNWDYSRVKRAIVYLEDKKIIGVSRFSTNMQIDKLTPEGIEIIENKKKFKITFGIELNLIIAKLKIQF